MEVLKDYALKIEEQLIEWRRHLHRYPECSFQEKETSAFVKKQLESIPGMTVFESNVGYGVVGTLSNGVGPTIALRADMDALPIKEEADVSFSSEHPGVMHACGMMLTRPFYLAPQRCLQNNSTINQEQVQLNLCSNQQKNRRMKRIHQVGCI